MFTGLCLGSREQGGFLALSWGVLLPDKTFQEGIAPASQRAEGVLSCQQQGEASERERQGGCNLAGVQEEQEMPVLPECHKGALPRARGVQGKFIAVQQAPQRCSAEKTTAGGRTHFK